MSVITPSKMVLLPSIVTGNRNSETPTAEGNKNRNNGGKRPFDILCHSPYPGMWTISVQWKNRV